MFSLGIISWYFKAYEPNRCQLFVFNILKLLAFASFMLGQVVRDTLTPIENKGTHSKFETALIEQYEYMQKVYNTFNVLLQYMFGYATLAIIDYFGTLVKR